MNKLLEKYNKLLEEGMDNFDMKKARKEIGTIRNDCLDNEEYLLKYQLLECLKDLIEEDK